MNDIDAELAIRSIVRSSVEAFAAGFEARHRGEHDDPDGTLNMKIHNVFIAVLGREIQYYTALVRSFDSSLGNMLEKMAITIAGLFYTVHKEVTGNLFVEQTAKIAELLEAYANGNNPLQPSVEHYKSIINVRLSAAQTKRHVSDYYLIDNRNNNHYLIELKIGGDLDNKKARAEKEALLEQYAILANNLGAGANIRCYFATAYNRFGENAEWVQERVLQFFSRDELMIGKDFWNFVCRSSRGYEIVIDEYRKSSGHIKQSLENIKRVYLG